MTYLSSGCRRVCRFRVHVVSLGGNSCAGVFAASSVDGFLGRRHVVLVQVGSIVVPHDCDLVDRFGCRNGMFGVWFRGFLKGHSDVK
jgi:hypothetical protein